MPSYDVRWSILVDADSEEEAANIARAIQLDPSNEAYVYTVALTREDDGTLAGPWRTVDLCPAP